MLYAIHQNHQDLTYQNGQEPIIHLEADLRRTVAWAKQHKQRWAFTLSNAGSRHFTDYGDLAQLDKINWSAVQAKYWSQSAETKEGKQAEFLIEQKFPWDLISRIGVLSTQIQNQVTAALQTAAHRPDVQIMRGWYY